MTSKNKTLSILKNLLTDDAKEFDSSFTLPNWNSKRLQAITKKLKKSNVNINKTDVAIKCLLLFQKKINKKKSQFNRPIRYNKTNCSYEKISIRYTPNDYNALNTQKNHTKISISYMFDLAIRMYLSLVYKLLLDLKNNKRNLNHISRYHRAMVKNSKNEIFLCEKIQFLVKITKYKKKLFLVNHPSPM